MALQAIDETGGTPIVVLEIVEEIASVTDPAIVDRIDAIESLKPITILQDVVLGDQEAVSMPAENPNTIGSLQQIETVDGSTDKVYSPTFTLVNSGRTAVFTSVITETNSKIILWPIEL